MMKRILLALGLACVTLVVVLILRTVLAVPSEGPPVERVRLDDGFPLAASHLAGAIRFPTVSEQDTSHADTTAFRALEGFLRGAFPRVFGRLQVEIVSGLSLLLTWEGSSRDLAPALFMSHLDVVPAGEDTLWSHAPFGGVIIDGQVWGRGAMDDKTGVVAVLEAVERLLAEDFNPTRTIYLSFGHDEEVGGKRGAAVIAETLAARVDRKLAFVLDEGGFIGEGLLSGLDVPVALVGIAEKGYLTLELSAAGMGGHSSTPPKVTAVGRVSRAVTRLTENPFEPRIDGAARAMFEHIGPHSGLSRRIVFSNLWLFGPLLKRVLSSDATTSALIRTTTAATMIGGGVKENVLPTSARAIVNFRILPGETTVTVTERIQRVIGDPEVVARPVNVYFDPSPVSDPEAETFQVLKRSILETTESNGLIVVPFLVPGATDSRYFVGLSDNIYRFQPLLVTRDRLETIHGTDERIGVRNVEACAEFVYRLLRNSSGAGAEEGV